MPQHLTPKLLRDTAKFRIFDKELTQQEQQSCIAVWQEAGEDQSADGYEPCYNELCSIVRECEGSVFPYLDDLADWYERQHFRSLWLLFLADVLEDGGLSS